MFVNTSYMTFCLYLIIPAAALFSPGKRTLFTAVLLWLLICLAARPVLSQDFHQGKDLYAQGYYDSAATCLQQYLTSGDTANLQTLCLYGESLALAGKAAEAEIVLEKVRHTAESQEQLYYQAKSLWLMGDMQLRTGQWQAAENQYRQALQAYTLQDTVAATLYRRTGLAVFSGGQYGKAEKYAQQAYLLMAPLPANHPDWADYYKLRGAIFDRQAHYDSALHYYEKSLTIHQTVHGLNHPETAKLLVNLANVYHVRGANARAAQHFRQALETMQTFLGKDHMLVAVIYNNMAIIDFDMGNFDKAIVYYQYALSIYQQKMRAQSLIAAQIMNNISSAYLEMEDAEHALQYAFQSLKIRQQQLDAHNTLLAPVYVNLADAYVLQQDFAKANRYLNQAISLYTSGGNTMHPSVAEAYTGLGESYLHQQQPRQALSFLAKARTISVALYGAAHTKLAYIHTLTGNSYLQLQQPDSALAYFDEAIAAALPGYQGESPETLFADDNAYVAQHFLMKALQGKAQALYAQYQADTTRLTALLSAHTQYGYLSRLMDDMRHAYQREESKLFLSGLATPVYAEAIEVTWRLYGHTQDPEYARQAFILSEKSKYALLSDFLNDMAAKYSAGIPQEVLEKEQTLKSRIAYNEKQLFEATDEAARAIAGLSLAQDKKEYLEFREQLEKDYPAYYQLKYSANTAQVHQVQQKLAKDEQLIEYTLADSALYVFVVRQDTLMFSRVRMETSLQEAVLEMRESLLAHDFPAYTRHAWTLYTWLAGTWGSEHKVIIIPDGILGYLPFEVLLSKKITDATRNYWRLPYLVKDHMISYHYSATSYLSGQPQHRATFPQEMVGFAPEFTEAPLVAYTDTPAVERSNRLVNLRGAQQELKKIAELFRGRFFFGAEATEANFKRASPGSRLIHVGTHGVLDDENPALSHLVFSGAADSTEDQRLHAYEIYNMKLQAELVTLSACNTGAGQLRAGEGVMSLARGFAYAGCPNVVTSLWAAPDDATARLMQRFYYYLHNGQPKDKALHQAKLDFLEQADENLADPYYWASFVLIGDTRPLLATDNPDYRWLVWLLALGAAVLVLGWMFYGRRM